MRSLSGEKKTDNEAKPAATKTPPFPTHARSVVRALRGAFAEVINAAGADPRDYQSIGRAFGLNKNLAWKLSKIVQAEDPASALAQMPGASGVKIFLAAATRAGVEPGLIRSARDAVDDYEELIRIHSGDRVTFEMMCSELGPAGRRSQEEQHRKQLFQGGSFVWGVQCRVNLKIGVVGPGAEPGLLEFASVNALLDFRRIRPEVTWVMASRAGTRDDGDRIADSPTEALDPRYDSSDQAPLMADFCSQPLPELRQINDAYGTSFQLVEGPVGESGALTCVVGALQRRIPYYRTEADQWGEHAALSHIPARLLIVDLFIHESFDFAMNPEALLLGDQGGGLHGAKGARPRLPLTDPLQDLGSGPHAPATPEVPRYAQLLRTVYQRTGWDPGEFRGFRVSIAYPPFPARLAVRYPLPERPDPADAE